MKEDRLAIASSAESPDNWDMATGDKHAVTRSASAFSHNRAQKKKTYGVSELSGVIGKWRSEELIFAVREPFPSKATGTTLVFGKVSVGDPLRIESQMGENGVIFSDGMESDFLAFNSGTEALITLADKRGHIVV
jgi:hypothetical protein